MSKDVLEYLPVELRVCEELGSQTGRPWLVFDGPLESWEEFHGFLDNAHHFWIPDSVERVSFCQDVLAGLPRFLTFLCVVFYLNPFKT